MQETIRAFREYRALGWMITPVRHMSKMPIHDAWNDPSEYDHNFIERTLTNGRPYNIGLVLGDIVDVEADSKEANARLEELIGDTPHPMYKSVRSVHHLFRCPDKRLTKVEVQGIEFRGARHQSVLPPSLAVDGVTKYTWLQKCNFQVPDMPAPLLRIFKGRMAQQFPKKGVSGKHETPHCKKCGNKSRPINRKRFYKELTAFGAMNLQWHCHMCRKILGLDLRPLIRAQGKNDV